MQSSRVILEAEEYKEISHKNTININVGVLGHIDSGKTSLSRVLSKITSTASLDKHPQSQERGITLDLGFSAFFGKIPESRLEEFQKLNKNAKYFQFTLVDCPGHASLIRTIIGGAQIIDIMLLVIDINKGIQTQTAECLVIGEILMSKMIVVLNKIDMIPEQDREAIIAKKMDSLKKVFTKTKFGSNIPMVTTSTCPGSSQENIDNKIGWNIDTLIDALVYHIDPPKRADNAKSGLLFMVDHCFSIKGQGTVTTGTILQGSIRPGDEIHFPQINQSKKVKSMQMFKKPVDYGGPGDRIATLFAGLDATLIERGIACQPGVVNSMECIVVPINKISYYKSPIKSANKFHITSGHQTIMGSLRLFIRSKSQPLQNQKEQKIEKLEQFNKIFQDDPQQIDGEYIEDYENYSQFKNDFDLYGLLELEKPLLASQNAMIIGSKLDSNLEANICRIAFYGQIIKSYIQKDIFSHLRIFRRKSRQGVVEKVIDNYTLLVKDMFKKETNINLFIGKSVILKLTGNEGKIESAFGKSGKVRVFFSQGVEYQTKLQQVEESKEQPILQIINTEIIMVFKKYLFHK